MKASISLDEFADCIFENKTVKVTMNNLVQNKERKMTRINYDKIGLTDLSLKMYINSDRISCKPFKTL